MGAFGDAVLLTENGGGGSPAPQPVDTETAVETIDGTRIVSGTQLPPTAVKGQTVVQQLPPSFSFGSPTPGIWTQLATGDEAKVGDVLRFTYHMKIPFFLDWQSGYLVSKLSHDPRFHLRSVYFNEEQRNLVVEVEVLQPFSPVIIIALAVLALAVGATIWMTTESIEKLGTVQVGSAKINLTGILVLLGIGLAAVVVLGQYGVLKRRRK